MSRRTAAEQLCSTLATVSAEFLEITDVINPAVVRITGQLHHVEPPTPVDRSVITSDSYEALYESQLAAGSFNFRMLDGALIQLSYTFKYGQIYQHRLAYLPSPSLNIYEYDVANFVEAHPFADIGGPQSVIVPIRFDYDNREGVSKPIHHPVSHCTLGQHANCRIPVFSALSPRTFLAFIVSSFYTLSDESVRTTLTSDVTFSNRTLYTEESPLLNFSHGCRHNDGGDAVGTVAPRGPSGVARSRISRKTATSR